MKATEMQAGRDLDAMVTIPTGTTVETIREVRTPFHTFAEGSRYVVTGQLDRQPRRVKVRPVGGGQERGIDPGHLREVRP